MLAPRCASQNTEKPAARLKSVYLNGLNELFERDRSPASLLQHELVNRVIFGRFAGYLPLPPIAIAERTCRHVRKAPLGDIGWDYSITSSARASIVGGIASPSAFAAFRLITSSNLVACCTGRSPGLSPLRIRPA